VPDSRAESAGCGSRYEADRRNRPQRPPGELPDVASARGSSAEYLRVDCCDVELVRRVGRSLRRLVDAAAWRRRPVLRRPRARRRRAAGRARGRHRAGSDPRRSSDGEARARDRLVAGDARAGPVARSRGGRGARPARGRHPRPRARGARGAGLLPWTVSAAPADVGRSSPLLRTRRGVASAERPLRLERVRVRPLGLLDVAGLRLEALYGGFAGEPLDDDSREYVFVARR